MNSNIPEARRIVEKVMTDLKPFDTFDEVQTAISDLESALSMMTRVITKKTVRRNVEITEEHRQQIRAIAANGGGDHYTCADIAVQVFGEPVNLGRVSAILAGREREYIEHSAEFFAESRS